MKTCNWNCVYCQLGRTMPINNERKDYYKPEEILSEVRQALNTHPTGSIDWVTFIGSGETCLHASLGTMIRAVKTMTDLPVAVITNGSLLYLPEVREELCAADAVLPSLDAGNPDLYRKINRPHPKLTFESLVEGLKAFRKQYSGKLWIEVMLLGGLNDTEAALQEIALVLKDINPDEVHILTPTRPPVETWVSIPDEEGLLRAQAILGQAAQIVHPASGTFELDPDKDMLDSIVSIITRHPMRESEILTTLEKWQSTDVLQTLKDLQASGKAQPVVRYGVRFWSAAPAFYPNGNNKGLKNSQNQG
jgi:wyosine [tRNA(Phe)-imidazoG37] synthetase (radical SAM superfamily)